MAMPKVELGRAGWFVLGMAVFFFLLWLFGYIFVFRVQDRLHPLVPRFRLDSAAVSLCPLLLNNASSKSSPNEYLTATWEFTIVVINSNNESGFGFYLEDLRASLFYGDKEREDKLMLAMAPLVTPLFFSKMNHTSITFRVAMASAFVGADVANQLSISSSSDKDKQYCWGSSVTLGFKLRSSYRFVTKKAGLNYLRWRSFFCNLNGTTTSPGQFQSRECPIFVNSHGREPRDD